jgi:hypothetical protein
MCENLLTPLQAEPLQGPPATANEKITRIEDGEIFMGDAPEGFSIMGEHG